ncbi:M48 family metallopeptidase [Clostridium sp. DJ247]|uniref:M48 family metallopeptidase n=1 Tax=Clostridium sp. DJ247 TaxID=2726188 RepID=UPI001F4C667E|nr:M48 family metallopeptidase [Clostridium sp. DJ247]MBC2582510.1 M48 family metallopeptidase [Clostridium sp. DJ247]
MKKELSISIILFLCLMIGFIFSVKITEERNDTYIKHKYVYSAEENKKQINYIAPPTEKAIEYQHKKVALWITNLVLSIGIPAIFLFSRFSANIRNWAQRRSKRAFITIILYFIVYSTITTIISLPIDYYSSFVLKHAYGLSNQTFLKWFEDILKNFILYTAAASIFIFLLYTLIKISPRRWWLYLGLMLIPIIFFLTFVSPVYIDPIFNKYERLQDKNLETMIYKQIDKTNIKNCQVFQVNKSVDTKEMNAYMTGVLNTKRIVLWDNTIKNLTYGEVLGIVAHEMGHYIMGHVWKAIIIAGVGSILVFYFINKSALWMLEKSQGIFGFNKLQDIASIPMLILLLNIFMFVVTPVSNAYSRYTEREADRFELELTKNNDAAVSSTIKLHENSLVLPTPGVIYKLWNYDHPTFEERVEFAKNYKPWEENKPIKYKNYIK